MPGGDRTGPMGMGPMTGRAAGYCAGYGVPGYMNPSVGFGRGRGFGMGRGRGMGWGRGWGRGWRGGFAYGVSPYYTGPVAPVPGAAPSGADEMEFLKAQSDAIQEELKAINGRIEELKKQTESEK